MAKAVAESIINEHMLICEAGTGIGKTFAYLIPALLSNKKVLISTGTKTLQDQLYSKDLPFILKSLGLSLHTALLKGRGNYLCRHRLELIDQDQVLFTPSTLADYQRVIKWQIQTEDGDISKSMPAAENSVIWPLVTSNTENCLGKECHYFDQCHVVNARRKAAAAHVVVVNHHLFFADQMLRDTGFAEILPKFDIIIFDEAHQLPEIASQFLGTSISSRQIADCINELKQELTLHAIKSKLIEDAITLLLEQITRINHLLGSNKFRVPLLSLDEKLKQDILFLYEEFKKLSLHLSELPDELSPNLNNIVERCHDYALRYYQVFNAHDENMIYWFENFQRSFRLNATPISVADELQQYINNSTATWIFTSATLSTNDDFSFYQDKMGLKDATLLKLDSPFDYAKLARLYIPTNLPDPRSKQFMIKFMNAVIPVLKASIGRAFVLFTSLQALQEGAEILQQHIEYPLFIQGTMSKKELLDAYVQSGNGVLLGSYSFWEGVDVRGEALSCVIIDRLPFASPTDPVLQARLQNLKNKGKNPFADYQIPEAVISFKQGVGRLIRDHQDRGIIMIGDNRFLYNQYSNYFKQAVKNIPIIRKLADVQAFFEEISACQV